MVNYDAPDCDYLRWDAVEKEWYCAFRLTRRDKVMHVCAYDDIDVREMRADGIICPCWRSLDEEGDYPVTH
jgi:hypothetical protein